MMLLLYGHDTHKWHLSCTDEDGKSRTQNIDEKEFNRVLAKFVITCESVKEATP
jgi:hypothetical protein